MKKLNLAFLIVALLVQCSSKKEEETKNENLSAIGQKLDDYESVRLTADLSGLTDNERQMIPILIDAGKIMDDLFWYEAYGDKKELMSAFG